MTQKLDELGLKWGTLKYYDAESDDFIAALNKYFELEQCISVALQTMTEDHCKLLCEVVDACNNPQIYLDWDGIYVSKEKAKEYIMGYRKK